ncbi:hypothetical protein J3A83DRAFT_4355858 [Scleroderma citrinum]
MSSYLIDPGDDCHSTDLGNGDYQDSNDPLLLPGDDNPPLLPEELACIAKLPKLQRSLSFIQAIRDMSLNNGTSLTGEDLEQLHNPPKEPLHVDDWYTELSLLITYIKIQKAIKRCFPGSELLSFYQTKHLLADLSEVTSVINHIPLSDLDLCPECSELWTRHPHVVFHMIPIAPQLQSLWWHPESAEKINNGLVNSYDDIFCGQAYLDAHDDTLLMILIDKSNCWIYIWIILELSPNHQYKKKHKLEIVDSFLFPGLHHLSTVQHEGLHIWDASQDCKFISCLFLFLACADGPGLLTLSNFVGHQSKNRCFLLKPDNYNVHGCDHPYVDIYIEQLAYLLSSQTQCIYEKQCLETEIPHLVQGIPEVFSLEMMHLSGANMAVLWLDLWCGTFDSTWEAHGCSFDVAPCDPSLHSNSWYKAMEYINWIYCLCPALLYSILPNCPWQNFCWFCACQLITEWALEFEKIFYQHHINHIPFIHPCVHLTCHLTSEAAMIPHLDPPKNTNPCTSTDLGNGYVLLAKHNKLLTTVQGEEAAVIAEYLGLPHAPKIHCWACLCLPNGQIAQFKYQELQRAPEDICMAHNVKAYWFQFANVTLIMLYSNPHPYLLDQSYGVLASCTKLEILAIQSVIAMVPHCPMVHDIAEDRYFLVEKTGM